MGDARQMGLVSQVPSIGPEGKRTTHIRSTLLMSSQGTLRAAGLFDRYWNLLEAGAREDIAALGAPAWLRVQIGLAHYRACDALGLSQSDVVELASKLGGARDGTFLGVAMNLARGVGLTPFVMASQLPRIWQRAFQGGAIRGTQAGAKELRIEVAGWPFAAIPYCRYALRGLCAGVAGLVAPDMQAHELSAGADDVCVQLTWK
jgi:hypothetical protein